MPRLNISSENGVTLIDKVDGDVVLSIPRELLDKLQEAWQSDDQGGTDYSAIVEAVRDLFDGEDGALQFLAQCGVPTVAC